MITPMLAKNYDGKQDPVGYWVSEKLDGVRSIFFNNRFYSRNGNVLCAPQWFIDSMPSGCVLDGELFTKRGDFQNIMSYVTKDNPIDSEWRRVKFMVFDLPRVKKPFEERYQMLVAVAKKQQSPYLKVVSHVKVRSVRHLDELHTRIVKLGGEGLMLRQPGSMYEQKRTRTLLKLKKFQDREAKIIGHELGKGKFSSVLGKVEVCWLDDPRTVFKVGSGFTDIQRSRFKQLFPIGTIIKVKYFEETKAGKPRFPIFLGVRARKDMPGHVIKK